MIREFIFSSRTWWYHFNWNLIFVDFYESVKNILKYVFLKNWIVYAFMNKIKNSKNSLIEFRKK